MQPGDTIVDGGNSNFKDSKRRHAMLKERGLKFVDAGISGGVWGLANGYGTMVGGDPEAVKPLEPIFTALAPPDGGYVYCGPPGAGHYTKMVHNGIEYGLMQAYAEGFEIMHASEYPLDLEKIAKAWMHGTVIRSWLLELAGLAFEQHGTELEGTSRAGSRTPARAAGPSRTRSTTTFPRRSSRCRCWRASSSRQDESYSARRCSPRSVSSSAGTPSSRSRRLGRPRRASRRQARTAPGTTKADTPSRNRTVARRSGREHAKPRTRSVPACALERVPDPCVIVIFGATGDLTRRKILPAIYNLRRAGLLPPETTVLGFSRRPLHRRRSSAS